MLEVGCLSRCCCGSGWVNCGGGCESGVCVVGFGDVCFRFLGWVSFLGSSCGMGVSCFLGNLNVCLKVVGSFVPIQIRAIAVIAPA